jgi:hypothetical protein
VLANVKGGAKIITYISSVAYMCASLSDGATLFEFTDYQAMAEDSRPSAWSKGRPGVVSSSRFYRVGYTDTVLRTLLRVISVSLVLLGCISPWDVYRYLMQPC